MKQKKLHTIVPILLLAVTTALSQTPSNPAVSKRNLASDDFYKKLRIIRDLGTAALTREQARSKKELCTHIDSGYIGEADCLAKEIKITEENYKAYISSIATILRLPDPLEAKAKHGTADPGNVFKQAEATWQTYRDEQCTSMSGQWNGNFVHVAQENCRISLTQHHMNELADLYHDLWH